MIAYLMLEIKSKTHRFDGMKSKYTICYRCEIKIHTLQFVMLNSSLQSVQQFPPSPLFTFINASNDILPGACECNKSVLSLLNAVNRLKIETGRGRVCKVRERWNPIGAPDKVLFLIFMFDLDFTVPQVLPVVRVVA
jgi:hypothetical protein